MCIICNGLTEKKVRKVGRCCGTMSQTSWSICDTPTGHPSPVSGKVMVHVYNAV